MIPPSPKTSSPPDPLGAPAPPPAVRRLNRAVLMVAAVIAAVTLLVVVSLAGPRAAPRVARLPPLPLAAGGEPGFLRRPPGNAAAAAGETAAPDGAPAGERARAELERLLSHGEGGGAEGAEREAGATLGAAAGAAGARRRGGPAGAEEKARSGTRRQDGAAGVAEGVPGSGMAVARLFPRRAAGGRATWRGAGLAEEAAGEEGEEGADRAEEPDGAAGANGQRRAAGGPARAEESRRAAYLRALRAPLAAAGAAPRDRGGAFAGAARGWGAAGPLAAAAVPGSAEAAALAEWWAAAAASAGAPGRAAEAGEPPAAAAPPAGAAEALRLEGAGRRTSTSGRLVGGDGSLTGLPGGAGPRSGAAGDGSLPGLAGSAGSRSSPAGAGSLTGLAGGAGSLPGAGAAATTAAAAAGGCCRLRAGTVIPAILVNEVSSELPGPLLAQVSRNVYDAGQETVVVPAGTRLLGRYENQVAIGQRRLLVAWTRILLPDGRSYETPGLPGATPAGAAGLPARVDNHLRRAFGDALLLSLLGAGAQLSQPRQSGFAVPPSSGEVAAAALGAELSRTATELARRDANLQPTLSLPAATPFAVFLNGDLVLPPAGADGREPGEMR